jgi:hypothetical protein
MVRREALKEDSVEEVSSSDAHEEMEIKSKSGTGEHDRLHRLHPKLLDIRTGSMDFDPVLVDLFG